MDFLTALLGTGFPEQENSVSGRRATPRLFPRIPALFEPLAPREDMEALEESFGEAMNEPAREQLDTPLTEEGVRADLSHTREPYRGVMNPPTTFPPSPPEAASSQNSPSRNIEPRIERVSNVAITEPAPEMQARTRGVIRPLRPAEILEPRPGKLREPAPQDAESFSAQLIHVNIGRIVVRAVSETPPASPKREAKSKKMSLDDYLNKRERGQR